MSDPPEPYDGTYTIFSPAPNAPKVLSRRSPVDTEGSVVDSNNAPCLFAASSNPEVMFIVMLVDMVFNIADYTVSLSPILVDAKHPTFSTSHTEMPVASSTSAPRATDDNDPVTLAVTYGNSVYTHESSNVNKQYSLWYSGDSSQGIFPLTSGAATTYINLCYVVELHDVLEAPCVTPINSPTLLIDKKGT